MEDRIVQKCLKSYLTAKKYIDTDKDKSFEYLKQCIKILDDIKEKNIKVKEDYINIIDETETECSKYLTMVIETTIEEPQVKTIKTLNTTNNELLEIIQTGNLNEMKKYKYGEIDFSEKNEDGQTPLHLAIKFGDTSFLKQAFKLGATVDQTNDFGHTLLEFACLEKDPNMINFITSYGGDMKKHLKFRELKKYFNNGNMLDIILLEQYIIEYHITHRKLLYLDWIGSYINMTDILDLKYVDPNGTITSGELILHLDNILHDFNKEVRDTYIMILKEELSYGLHYKLGCPTKMIEIILYNLVPFINYEPLKLNWLVSLEIKYIILKILKSRTKINTKQLKQELSEHLYKSYFNSLVLPEGLIQSCVLQWINKIKV